MEIFQSISIPTEKETEARERGRRPIGINKNIFCIKMAANWLASGVSLGMERMKGARRL